MLAESPAMSPLTNDNPLVPDPSFFEKIKFRKFWSRHHLSDFSVRLIIEDIFVRFEKNQLCWKINLGQLSKDFRVRSSVML